MEGEPVHDKTLRDLVPASAGRRSFLKAMAALGAGGPSLLAFAEALAQAKPDEAAKLTILIQGGPVAEPIKNIANPMFNARYPNAEVQLEVSSNAAGYPKMLAQRNNPVIGGGMFNDLFSFRGQADKMWVPFNPEFLTNAARVPAEVRLPNGIGMTFQQTPFGIMYNPDRVEAPKSWTDLWNPKYKGRVSMWDAYFDGYAMAAVATGKPPSVEDGIKAWEPHKANIGAWASSPIAEEDLVHRGEVWLAPHWGAWTEQARLQGKKVAFALPKEGGTLWSNQLQCSAGFSPTVTELIQRYLNTWLSDEVQTAWLKDALISPAVLSVPIPAELKSNVAIVAAAESGKLIRLDAQQIGSKFNALRTQIERTLKA